jgi:hypothetical protein
LSKSSALLPIDNPRKVTGGYQTGPIPVTTGTFGHHTSIRLVLLAYRAVNAALMGLLSVRDRPTGVVERITGLIAAVGDIVFLANDEEAYWRGWTIERRYAGLSRRYRNPLFDTLASCPHCRGWGITPDESSCVKCSGTGRVTVDQPPFPHDG